MPSVTIRNVSDETHRAIRARAALHGRSMEAEAREMLESVQEHKSSSGWERCWQKLAASCN